MKKLLFGIAFFLATLLASIPQALAQEEPDLSISYTLGTVQEVLLEEEIDVDGNTYYFQRVRVVDDGTGEISEMDAGSEFQPLSVHQKLSPGMKVVLSETQVFAGEEAETVIADIFRIPALIWLMLGFAALVLVVAKWKGFFSVVGMFVSLAVVVLYIVPQILSGHNPVVVSLLGSCVIGATTMYLAHGWKIKSHLGLISILGTLFVVGILAASYVGLANLTGLGSEQAYFLQFGPHAVVNVQGILLGGILLGALGVLDDIAVAQISIVHELKLANVKLNPDELYKRAMRVGKDHVASLVNTLVLAYAGANLPLFILFTSNNIVPTWVQLNSELIAEEIVRTLVGSIGLVLAVPITTVIAVAWYSRAITEENHDEHQKLAETSHRH